MEKEKPMFEYVLAQLKASKGKWPTIAKAMEPESWESYYSWLTKLAQGTIPDPSVNKIQRLKDYFEISRVVTKKLGPGDTVKADIHG